MPPHHHSARRTAALLLVAALLASAAPAQQTRRRPAATPAQPSAQTTTATAAKPATQTTANSGAKPAETKAHTAPTQSAGRAASGETVSSSSSSEVSIDNMFAAETYAVYGEMRMVGQHASSADFRQMLEPLRLPGALPGELQQLLDFITAHADELTAARVALGAMPTKPGLPMAVIAVELTSVEEARQLVPQLRTTFAKFGAGAQGEGVEEQGASSARRGARRRAAQKKRPAGAEGQAMAVREAVEQSSPPPFQIRRSGRVVALSDVAFTFKSLRGAAGAMALTNEPGFQAVRSRFANDTLFLYINTTRMTASTRRQVEESERKYKEFEEQQRREANGKTDAPRAVAATVARRGVTVTASDSAPPPDTTKGDPDVIAVPEEFIDLSPAMRAEMEKTRAEEEERQRAEEEALNKRTPEEIARQREAETRREFENQLGRMIFSAGPGSDGVWPESIGVGASFSGDAVVVRSFFLSGSEETPLRPIPFMPILHAGPQITSEAANVLPAETDILVSASLDLQQMYDYVASMFKLFDLATTEADKQGLFDSQINSFERDYKFRIKEDLLKALGNEIAIAIPSEMFGVRSTRAEPKAEAKDSTGAVATASSEPPPRRSEAPVVLISLRDKRAMQDLLPRALEATGIKGLNAQQLLEKRGGAELVTFSQGAVAFIDRFLVIAFEPGAMNRVIEAYNAGETLSATDEYRNPTAWQPKQGLGHVYVSNALAKGMIGDVSKDVEDVGDETLRNFVTRLDPNPGAVTLAATKDGGLMYELHIPKNLLSMLSVSGMMSQQLAPIRAHESMAGYELRNISGMQSAFKEKHGRYASLEEIKVEAKKRAGEADVPDGPRDLTPYEAQVEGYEIKISASGDRFEATATPTGYPKQGRRSFYIDQTGQLRGADLGGRAANSATGPVTR